MTQNVTPEQARAIAREAYIFHYPLVMYYRTMYRQAIDRTSKTYTGGFGEWLHAGMSSPDDTDIVSPNNDTPYSYAWVDLRAEPWVLTMPPIDENRFYTSQWDDLWGFVLDNPGSLEDGNDGVSVLLASPTWSGDLPKGIKRVVQGDSSFLGTLTRTQVFEPKDLPFAQQIQHAYNLQPLSDFLRTPAPKAAPVIDWKPWKAGAETTTEFWAYANFLLSFISPDPQDKLVHDRAAKIGIVAGKSWDASSFDSDVSAAIAAGMKDALLQMKEAATKITDPGLFFRSRRDLNKDYFNRAVGVLAGIFGNVRNVSVYFAIAKDDQGDFFDGTKNSYRITFAADEIPPVRYFWSLTMYRLPQRSLVDNPIHRYSIGSATPELQTAADGSITIYIQAKSPGPDKLRNWLPAPDGPFWPVLRTYGPGKRIRDRTWKVPPVRSARIVDASEESAESTERETRRVLTRH
jgi:hypothetical protein